MTFTINCNLYNQYIAGIRKEFDAVSFKHSSYSDDDCAIYWEQWSMRKIPVRKRNIEKAKSFNCPSHLVTGLSDLETAINNGNPLWPWQSKGINRITPPDGLYFDFKVAHFHLGKGLDGNGYITRTKELLFALVTVDTFFEIGIYNHGEWYEFDILNIIDDNWPQLLDNVTHNGIAGVAHIANTRKEIQELREAYINSVRQISSGRIIVPPGGDVTLSKNGISTYAIRNALKLRKIFRDGEKQVREWILAEIKKGNLTQKDYSVELYMTDQEIAGIIDSSIKITIRKN